MTAALRALRTGGTPGERRVALAAAGGFLLTVRTAAADSLDGRLVLGWLLTLTGLALVLLALRPGLTLPPRLGRHVIAVVVALGVAGGVIAVTQAALRVAVPVWACRDDVSVAPIASARLLTEGSNPYVSFDSVAEQRRCGSHGVGTVVQQGRFAGRVLMPSDREIQAAAIAAWNDPSRPEVERRLAYPGGTVLAGLLGPRGLEVLVILALAGGMTRVLRRTPRPLRWVTGLGLAGQLAAWTLLGDGHVDGIAFGLATAAWAAPASPLSALLLGLACGTKQTVWFLVPALLATAAARGGIRAGLRAAVLVAAGFLVLNAGFIAADPEAWLRAVLSPQLDGLFPLGAGAIGLVTSGLLGTAWLPLFAAAPYVVTVAAAWAAWRLDRVRPGIGAVLASMALWVGQRSLLEYMAGAGLLAVTVTATAPGAVETADAGQPRTVRAPARAAAG